MDRVSVIKRMTFIAVQGVSGGTYAAAAAARSPNLETEDKGALQLPDGLDHSAVTSVTAHLGETVFLPCTARALGERPVRVTFGNKRPLAISILIFSH